MPVTQKPESVNDPVDRSAFFLTPLYRSVLKRGFDLAIALILLTLLAPVMGLVSMLIWLIDGRPVLFWQERPGRYEIPFILYKFRTMRNTRSGENALLSDSERLTRLGRVLRALSLDELPQLWNVVRGDMSLIGPRPLLSRYIPYFTALERTRHLVRPGITGLAQVNGRNNSEWNTRLSFDIEYVNNVSAVLDLKIVFLTVINVFSRTDVVVDPSSEMLDLDKERADSNPHSRVGFTA